MAGQSRGRLRLPCLCRESLLHTRHGTAALLLILLLLAMQQPLHSHSLDSLLPSPFSAWTALLPAQLPGRCHGYQLLMLNSYCK